MLSEESNGVWGVKKMGLMTSGVALRARTALRKAGASRVVMDFLRSRGYEQALTRAMHSAVRPGDVVWDVGANIGEYAAQFADWVGLDGRVYAFEPRSPVRWSASLATLSAPA